MFRLIMASTLLVFFFFILVEESVFRIRLLKENKHILIFPPILNLIYLKFELKFTLPFVLFSVGSVLLV